MKIHTIDFHTIAYTKKTYDSSLKESLLRMGIGFPLQVKQIDANRYECVDGHKRLSAIHDILMDQSDHKLCHVKAVLLDQARTPSGTAKNHH